MRWLINYIRSCFCKHDWEKLKDLPVYDIENLTIPMNYMIVYRCKKCGMVQKIKVK